MPQNTPNINIQNGQVTGTLQDGQPFYWYNPTSVAVTIGACGTWCTSDSYSLPAGPSYTQAQLQNNPNPNGWAWYESPNDWAGGGGGPHITNSNGNAGPPTPNINVQTGQVTGTLLNGTEFYWYNPTSQNISISGCGAWCVSDVYNPPAGKYQRANLQAFPNTSAFAWTETPNQWNVPGMPHIQTPGRKRADEKVA
ncbi:MAG TPA: hypothetical protein VMH04_03660 [Candidatus Solibacter sp.]|nr:hypothetical protein [Candidatus Solibacter sp.]